MSTRCICVCAVILAAVSLGRGAAHAGIPEFSEDFTTLQYCDTLVTTASWDTLAGAVELPPYQLMEIGSYDVLPYNSKYLAVAGDYVYVVNRYLHVFDIEDPTAPALLGSTLLGSESAEDIHVEGRYAYVSNSALYIVDVLDPGAPSLTGTLDIGAHEGGLAVSGDIACIATQSDLVVVDISNPAAPATVGSYPVPFFAEDVKMSGNRAYVAAAWDGLMVIDVANPMSPMLVGSLDPGGGLLRLALAGGLAYFSTYGNSVAVIDIAVPTAPSLITDFVTPYDTKHVHIQGDYAYVPSDYYLQTLDVENPAEPAIIGTTAMHQTLAIAAVDGEYAFVAGSVDLEVFAAADRVLPPVEVGGVDTPETAMDVEVSGNFAFVADEVSGLQVVDISNPRVPSIAGSCDTPGEANGVAISGRYAFVTDINGLYVIDIRDEKHPALVGGYSPFLDEPQGIAVSGRYAYIAQGYEGLQMVDIVNPLFPTPLLASDTPGYANAVVLHGDLAYVADGPAGLQVIDVHDPWVPMPAGSYDTPGDARDLVIAGRHVFIADGLGLQIADIGNPTTPVFKGSCTTPGTAIGVDVAGNYACVADGDGGLVLIDISDPADPVVVGTNETAGHAYAVDIYGDHVIVVDGQAGLRVVEILSRLYDGTANLARSLPVDGADDLVLQAHLTATHADSVSWMLSADGGAAWEQIPLDTWHVFTSPGTDLMWQSQHYYRGARQNPACSSVLLQWLGESPVVSSATDVPNDQGRQVSLSWMRSGYDYAGSPVPITEYAVFRRIDDPAPEKGQGKPRDETVVDDRYPPGDWHFLMTVPAYTEETYTVVVPTLADSTVEDGMVHSVFFVRAGTGNPGVFYDADPDSGYSVDNLAPGVPTGFMVAYGAANDLTWEECADEDFRYFKVYRGAQSDFEVDPEHPLHTTTGNAWTDIDGGYGHHYKLSTVDHAGNESMAGAPGSVTGTYPLVAPARTALHDAVPNPFNPTTKISFELAAAGRILLAVYDAAGRRITTLVDGHLGAGPHEAIWDGRDAAGRDVAAGVFLARLEFGTYRDTKRMVLVK